MSEVRIDWATARVEDGELAVRLAGDRQKGWKRHFRRTSRLLANSDWGEVELKKGTIYVTAVSPGTEEKLRHHLDSVVEQANAALPEREPDEEARAEDGNEHDGGGPDADMTERFRSFAERPE